MERIGEMTRIDLDGCKVTITIECGSSYAASVAFTEMAESLRAGKTVTLKIPHSWPTRVT